MSERIKIRYSKKYKLRMETRKVHALIKTLHVWNPFHCNEYMLKVKWQNPKQSIYKHWSEKFYLSLN